MSKRQRRSREKRRRHRNLAPSRRQVALGTSVITGATLVGTGTAHAATYNVTNLYDSGAGSLRQAILDANAHNTEPNAITFDSGLSGSITLASDLPQITNGVSITGPGAGAVTVDGGDDYGIFNINIATANDDVSISGLTLSDGYSPAGGAIYNADSDLTVSDSVISGNGAQTGGGIFNAYELEMFDTTLSGNVGYTAGGGVANYEAYMYGSGLSFEGNFTGYGGPFVGGGIWNRFAGSYVTGSTFAGNRGYYAGGAVYSTDAGSYFRDTTFAGNITGFYGGAVAAPSGGFVGIADSTLYDNFTYNGGGGGIFAASDAYVALYDATVSGNSAGDDGGGLYTSNASGYEPLLDNTIVANNSASGVGPDIAGTVEAGFSLVEDPTAATINDAFVCDSVGTNRTGVDPQLGPLASNGGPTQTLRPAPTSPAIDQGGTTFFSTDQRLLPRPFDNPAIPNAPCGDGNDIGAVELQASEFPSPPAAAQPSNQFGFGKLRRNLKKGIAFLPVNVPGPGQISLTGPGVAKVASARSARAVGGPGLVTLKVAPGKKGKKARNLRRALLQKGKATVKVKVTFVPTGGTANTKARKVKLIRK